MKKILGIVVVLLVLCYPAIAWLMGFVIEARVGLPVGQLNAQTPYLTIVDQKYHRGWYTSEQDVTLAFSPGSALGGAAAGGAPAAWAANLRFTVHSVIHHGPLCGPTCVAVARIDTQLVLSDEAKALVSKVYGATPPLKIESRLNFLGGGAMTISNPPIKDFVTDDGTHLSWDGFEIRGTYAKHNDAVEFTGTAPHLLVSAKDGSQLELAALSLHTRNHRVLPLLYAGDMEFSVGKTSFARAGGAGAVAVEDVHYNVKATPDGEFIDMALSLGSGAVHAAAANLKATHLDFSFTHLQMQAMETMSEKMQAFNQQRAGASSAPDPGAMFAALKEPAIALLLQNPELHFDLVGFETAHGAVALKGVVRLVGVAAADLAPGADPKALVAKVEANLDLSIDDAALAEMPGMGPTGGQKLQAMAKQGFVNRQGNGWHSKIRFSQGQLTMNDQPFSPAAMSGQQAPPPGMIQPMPTPNVVPAPAP